MINHTRIASRLTLRIPFEKAGVVFPGFISTRVTIAYSETYSFVSLHSGASDADIDFG